MLITRCPWGVTTVLLCTLLLQNCQSNSLRATEEEEPASGSSSASGMRHLASIVPQATLYLPLPPPSSAPAVHVPPSRFPIALANKKALTTTPSSRSLSPPVPPILATVGTPPKVPSTLQPAAIPRFSHVVQLRNTPSHSPSPVLTTSSGERVKFSQVDGQWCAAIQAGSDVSTFQRTMPVVGSGDIEALFTDLQRQDVWASRSLIHVMAMPNPPYSPCVYLGKVGLLGGMQESTSQGVSQAPRTIAQEAWFTGPTMNLASNQTRTEICHIQPGYRYKGYRLKPGWVIQRASCTIRYVEANSREKIAKLEGHHDGSALEVKLSEDFAQVVNLGTLEGGMKIAHMQGHQGAHRSSFTHAALVLHGSTKKNKPLKKESRLGLELEILVVPEPASSSMPPSFGDNASQVARLSSAETASALSSLFASASVSSPATFADSKPVARPTNSMNVPLMAFGATEWKHYFGEVGAAPPLPADIDSILNSPCPFWRDKRVKDTHLLVLIPATVGGVPFTLNQLVELVQHPKNGGHSTKYSFYGDSTKSQVGRKLSPRSYWLLMTRDVLLHSRYRMYRAQEGMAATYASQGYALPSGLEAATAILMHHARTGERLFGNNPYTYTRCLDVDKDGDPFAVGGFASSGLDVGYDYGFYSHERGVACCRKF